MMRKTSGLCLLFVHGAMLVACGDDGGGTNLFPPKPECMGEAIAAYMGQSPQVISTLEIGTAADGFDLDRDGDPDNKLAAVANLAKSSIDDSLANYDIIIPLEFYDTTGPVADTCVKFAIYLGDYVVDRDGDGEDPYVDGGDCNDNVMAIGPGAAEISTDRVDNDCDGLANEDAQNMPSTDTTDMDGDGLSMATGDCDDTPVTGMGIKPGNPEICGDGLDNDCDGVADRTEDAAGVATACSPFHAYQQDIPLDPLSFTPGTMEPVISFRDGEFLDGPNGLALHAGPSLFSVAIPVTDGLTLELKITGATIEADVDPGQGPGQFSLRNGRLGGVIDAKTADTIRGLEVEQIGLLPENSLLDATFANLLGPLLALPKSPEAIGKKYPGCRTPDIDVDQDGLESFCDSDPDDDIKVVDVCIDGDGTEVRDMGTMHCSEAVVGAKPRFVDGISVELNFATTGVKSIKPPRP